MHFLTWYMVQNYNIRIVTDVQQMLHLLGVDVGFNL